ncbi:hypothetical protein D8S78_17165 [Natrialba swarupiae]|nr:hypothetical protein [Natrialba swarupiae]
MRAAVFVMFGLAPSIELPGSNVWMTLRFFSPEESDGLLSLCPAVSGERVPDVAVLTDSRSYQSSACRWLRRFHHHDHHDRPNQALDNRTPSEELCNQIHQYRPKRQLMGETVCG